MKEKTESLFCVQCEDSQEANTEDGYAFFDLHTDLGHTVRSIKKDKV